MNTTLTREDSSGHSSRRAYRHEWDGVVVDTVQPPGERLWGTSINCECGQASAWHLVEQYRDEAEAREGHSKWLKAMIDSPTQMLPDLSMWRQ